MTRTLTKMKLMNRQYCTAIAPKKLPLGLLLRKWEAVAAAWDMIGGHNGTRYAVQSFVVPNRQP